MSAFHDLRKLGEGSYGEVWLCEQVTDRRQVAVKRLKPTFDPEAERRFVREVGILLLLNHPNIITVLDKHLDNSPYWYSMPYYPRTLHSALDSIQGNHFKIAPVFKAVLEAMCYAHARGVIHRDIKSENILLGTEGECVVTDFGLGRDISSNSARTMSGFGMGTVFYAAPEQMTNAKTADARSDIYSLGRLLFEMYCGKQNSPHTHIQSIRSRLCEDKVRNRKCTLYLQRIVRKCVQIDPRKRFQSVKDLKSAWLMALQRIETMCSPPP